jgi:hypothetical protein
VLCLDFPTVLAFDTPDLPDEQGEYGEEVHQCGNLAKEISVAKKVFEKGDFKIENFLDQAYLKTLQTLKGSQVFWCLVEITN